jgi:acyl-CoA reductase-like NAD-dependent aldehyde dehydrogenase
VIPFGDEAEAIEIANGVEYGLTATIWTENVGRAHRVASRVEAGQVAVNGTGGGGLGLPFGGYKRSGVGRKKDFTETMREFTTVKAIRIDTSEETPSL